MGYLRPIFVVVILFWLTCCVCWVLTRLIPLNPFCSIGFLIASMLGIVMAVDAIASKFSG